MESVYATRTRNGTNMFSDRTPDMRMGTRPSASSARLPQPTKGKLYEDFGSDFGPKARETTGPNGGRYGGGSSQQTTSKGKARTRSPTWTDSLSDEDLFGQEQSKDELDVITPEKKLEAKKWDSASNALKAVRDEAPKKAVVVHGQVHAYHPDYLPKKKFPDFKKIKRGTDMDSNVSTPTSNLSQEAIVDGETYKFPLGSPSERSDSVPCQKEIRPPPPVTRTYGMSRTRDAVLSKPFKTPSRVTPPSQARTSDAAASSSKLSTKPSILSILDDIPPTRPLRERSANEAQRRLPSPTSCAAAVPVPDTDDDDERTNEKTPRPPPRRKPRLLNGTFKAVKVPDKISPPLTEETPITKPRPRPRPLSRGTKAAASNNEAADSVPIEIDSQDEDKGQCSAMKPQPFPMDDMSPVKNGGLSSGQKSKATRFKSGSMDSSSSRLPATAAFPMPSPLSSPASKRSSRSKARKSKAKAAAGVVYSSSEHTESSEDEPARKPAIRDFPMNTQLLESIGLSPGKRASEGSDPGDVGRNQRRKRRKNSGDLSLEIPVAATADDDDNMSPIDDNDLRFFDPNVDPSTLCPWCDYPLPPNPTPYLLSLIAATRQKSYADPRPANPLALWAPLTTYTGVCARHDLESDELPKAQAQGWPTSIQWDALEDRVRQMKTRLQAIIDDVDEDFLPGRLKSSEERIEKPEKHEDDWEDEELQQARPRKGSVFWADAIKNVKKQGSKQASGVRGQLSNFAKTQPGYYGELGYVIINNTIYDLFPPANFEAGSALPLIPTEFIELILIPEAALTLIMEDMSQSRKRSIKTLRESAAYGMEMFRDDLADRGNNVGENIVRERARNRRQELGDEDDLKEADEEMSEAAQSESGKAKGKRRGRPPKKKPQSVADSSEGEGEKRPSQSQTRKRRTAASPAKPRRTPSQQDVIMISDSGESAPSTQSKPRPTRKPKPRSEATLQSSAAPCHGGGVVDLCEGSDSFDAFAIELSLGQRKNTSSSENDNHDHKGSDTDVDLDLDVQEPPSSSQLMREVTWDPNGRHHITQRSSSAAPSEHAHNPNATPKRRTFSRTSSSSSLTRAVLNGGQGSAVFPLDVARKRAGNTLLIEKRVKKREAVASGEWLSNMDLEDDAL